MNKVQNQSIFTNGLKIILKKFGCSSPQKLLEFSSYSGFVSHAKKWNCVPQAFNHFCIFWKDALFSVNVSDITLISKV